MTFTETITSDTVRRARALTIEADFLASKARAADAACAALRRRVNAALAYLDSRAPVDSRPYTEREYCFYAAEYRKADAIAERIRDAWIMADYKARALTASVYMYGTTATVAAL